MLDDPNIKQEFTIIYRFFTPKYDFSRLRDYVDKIDGFKDFITYEDKRIGYFAGMKLNTDFETLLSIVENILNITTIKEVTIVE